MHRRQFIQLLSIASASLATVPGLSQISIHSHLLKDFKANSLLNGFTYGAATAAYQCEGAWNIDGKGPSIWDKFSHIKRKIKDGSNGDRATDFYHRYYTDLLLLKELNLDAFRFSVSWPRVLPQGTGKINDTGLDFYKRLTDACLELNIEPWLTLYHWDLPQELEDKGGWTNRDMIGWFEEYTYTVSKALGDRVNHWMVLNEPMSFTSLGYLIGNHAPGKYGLRNFLPAVHHAALCQSAGARVLRSNLPLAQVGTTYSTAIVEPVDEDPLNLRAAKKIDAAMNRLFLEPALGMGYPLEDLKVFEGIEKYILPDDEQKLAFDFDFVGLQYYFRLKVKHSLIPPFYVQHVPANKKLSTVNSMGMEIYPEGIYELLKRFSSYPQIKNIYITENGVCFPDQLTTYGQVHDQNRIQFIEDTLHQVIKAKKEGVPVNGYFVWSLTDNFEWQEGYLPRFGLVYVDYITQERYLKDSGRWLAEWIKETKR